MRLNTPARLSLVLLPWLAAAWFVFRWIEVQCAAIEYDQSARPRIYFYDGKAYIHEHEQKPQNSTRRRVGQAGWDGHR